MRSSDTHMTTVGGSAGKTLLPTVVTVNVDASAKDEVSFIYKSRLFNRKRRFFSRK